MAENRCAYEGCDEPVNSPHDEMFCVFHAPKENKGIKVEEFSNLIWRRLNSRCFNFRGFIFPGDISFRGECKKSGGLIAFAEGTDFSDAQFMGNANFIEAQFLGDADFREAQFSGNAYFREAQFSGDAIFSKARFSADADFIEAQFSGDAYFIDTQFSGEAYFNETQFSGFADFSEAKFLCDAEFIETQFSGVACFRKAQFSWEVYFDKSRFDDRAEFDNILIKDTISYINITLMEKARFYFIKPTFVPEENEHVRIIFDVIQFNPFAVYFENIRYLDKNNTGSRKQKAVLIFRYCQLKDVYFTNNEMSLFSFYKSSFDQARFISSDWSPKKDKILKLFNFDRKNIIPEEKFYEDIRNHEGDKIYIEKLKANCKIEDLNGYEDISSLYRQMKTALDNTKDYQQASWFYFNEFEMKRLTLKDELKDRRWPRRLFSRISLYNMYKTFAGYGEKPLWSTIWFGIFSFLFAFIHMFNGIDRGSEYQNEIKYSLKEFINYSDYLKIIADIIAAWFYSLSRVIPVSYFSENPSGYSPMGPNGSLISFFNSLILIILAIFIAIGLKRHFRRF